MTSKTMVDPVPTHTRLLPRPIALKELAHLPVIVDPTDGAGRPSLIEPIRLAAVAAGADGIIVEVHDNPPVALSDKEQALWPHEFSRLARRVRALVDVLPACLARGDS